jgi:ribonuclease-3
VSGEARRRRLRALVRRAGISATQAGDLAIVERAFVHDSHARERNGASNERLEFLGDSVLGFLAAAWLYETFPDDDEGLLTVRKARIVNDAELARTARRLRFAEVLELGTGMRNAGGEDNPTILAGAFEAFVAALAISYGLETARLFVETQHIVPLDHRAAGLLDPKTRLQHHAQEHLGGTPVYRDANVGTLQAPMFASEVEVNGAALGTGTGPSKRSAQQAAAQAALAALELSGA